MKKYVFTGETVFYKGRLLKRIKYVRFTNKEIPYGTLGGWIENEGNLSHHGNCWVADNAMVYENARVQDDAWVYGNLKVGGNVIVKSTADLCGNDEIQNGEFEFGIHEFVKSRFKKRYRQTAIEYKYPRNPAFRAYLSKI